MIKFRDKILENYSIDPVTAVITNSKGEVQETKNKDGRPRFHCMDIHKIQAHTHLGYKPGFDIHHLDENKMNNSLSNLVYLTHAEHAKLHQKGKPRGSFSEETRKKMSEAHKSKNLSEETRKKLSDSHKGKTSPNKGKHHSEEIRKKISEALKGKRYKWINNGIKQRRIPFDEEIPEGFVRGRIK